MDSILLSIPNDILLDVLDHLPQDDLRNLTLVSSRLASPAQRILYRSISLELEPPTKAYPERGWSITTGNLYKFTRLVTTLSQNPHLRGYVSKLSIKVCHHRTRVHFDDHDNLLSLVPQLKSLSLEPPPTHLQLSKFSLPILDTLRFSFDHRRGDFHKKGGKHPLEVVAPCFWNSKLLKLSARGIDFSPEMRALFPELCYGTSPITNLELSSIRKKPWEKRQGCLPDIILCIKKLESFTFEFQTRYEWEEPCIETEEPTTISQLLSPHADTLVYLEISRSGAPASSGVSIMGSLVEYKKLKRLTLPEPFLLGTYDEFEAFPDLLPPNVEEINFQYPKVYLTGQFGDGGRPIRIKKLEKLAAAKPERLQALRRVTWWYQPDEVLKGYGGLKFGSSSDMDHISTIFREVGVEFQLHLTS